MIETLIGVLISNLMFYRYLTCSSKPTKTYADKGTQIDLPLIYSPDPMSEDSFPFELDEDFYSGGFTESDVEMIDSMES